MISKGLACMPSHTDPVPALLGLIIVLKARLALVAYLIRRLPQLRLSLEFRTKVLITEP